MSVHESSEDFDRVKEPVEIEYFDLAGVEMTTEQWGHFFRNLPTVIDDGLQKIDITNGVPVPTHRQGRFERYLKNVMSGDYSPPSSTQNTVESEVENTQDLKDYGQTDED